MGSPESPAPVAIIINTCLRYLPVTVPPLLRSLRDAGTPMGLVHVVAGETPTAECGDGFMTTDEDEAANPRAHVHHVPYGNVDNNALIWAATQDADA